MSEKTGAEMFGEPVKGEAVRDPSLAAADKREAAEMQMRIEACAGCGRLWLHSLASGHGDKAQRQADGLYWHHSCFTRRPR